MLQETPVLPSINVFHDQIAAYRLCVPQRLGVLTTFSSIQDETTTGHSLVVHTEKFDQPSGWVIVYGPWKLAYSRKPFLEGNNALVWNVESIRKGPYHLSPWLPRWVFNVIDRICWPFP